MTDPGHVLPHAPAWDHHSPSDVVSRLTAYASLDEVSH